MEQQHSDLTANSILLVLRLRKPGNRRKVSTGLVDIDADKAAISVGKELLESEELQAIGTLDGAIRKHLYSRSLPAYGVLKDGAYRLPITLVNEIDDDLLVFRNKRQDLIEAFLAVYPERAAMARIRLRVVYDPADYPPVDEMRTAFGFDYRYMTFGIPDSISATLMARERAKAAADVQSEVEEIKLALRSSFLELVEHASSRLISNPDGKKVVFRDSLVKNMTEFFRYFEHRNLVGDTELAALVERARGVLTGVDAEDLRKSDSLRAHVQQTMAQIKETMNESLMVAPTRRFYLPTRSDPIPDPTGDATREVAHA